MEHSILIQRCLNERERGEGKSSWPYRYGRLRELMTNMTFQLLDGCGNPTCTEQLCLTGRRNNTSTPIREHTPRSARAIVLALASDLQDLQSHLCPYYTRDSSKEHLSRYQDEGPGDPSSLMQQLADTKIVRGLCGFSDDTPSDEEFGQRHQRSWLQRDMETNARSVSSLFVPPFTTAGEANQGFCDNLSAAVILDRALDDIKRSLPVPVLERAGYGYDYVDNVIRQGQTVPHPSAVIPGLGSCAVWLAFLEALDARATSQLSAQVCGALAYRTSLEDTSVRLVGRQRDDKGILHQLIARMRDRVKSMASTGSSEELGLPSLFSAPPLATQGIYYDQMHQVWLKKTFLKHWDGKPMVQRGTIACGALELLEALHVAMHPETATTETAAYYLPAIADRVDADEMAQSWLASASVSRRHKRHLLTFPFLFTHHDQLLYFRTANYIRMRDTQTQATIAEEMVSKLIVDRSERRRSRYSERLEFTKGYYLLLSVSREDVLKDAYDQLWQRRRSELLRPLRVRMAETEGLEFGHDVGGVQVEFFNTVMAEAFSEDAGLFTTDLTTGRSYFRVGSLQPLHMFELFGLVVALALYNGITIPVSFPIALYGHLLDQYCGDIDSIRDGWPTIANSLQAIKEHTIEDLEYSISLEANGMRFAISKQGLESLKAQMPLAERTSASSLLFESITPIVHQADSRVAQHGSSVVNSSSDAAHRLASDMSTWPGWTLDYQPSASETVIDEDNKHEYIHDYITFLTTLSVLPQLAAFKRGFFTIFTPSLLSLFTPYSLQSTLEGTAELDISILRQTTQYEGFHPDCAYMELFWLVVARWPEAKQRALIKFVTAAERIPAGGAGTLEFKIQQASELFADDSSQAEEQLPTSSTCFATLYLPYYPNEETLERKLTLALEFGGVGFGAG